MTTKNDKGKPAEHRSTRSSVLLVLVPPAIVFLGGLAIGIAWDKEGWFGRSLRAAFVSTAGPVAFLFDANLFVRALVAVGLVVVYALLARRTPLGRAKAHKVFLGSLIWCAIGFVAFIVKSGG